MMLRNFLSRTKTAAAAPTMLSSSSMSIRRQGTSAMARHANNRIAIKSSTMDQYQQQQHQQHEYFSSMNLKRDDGDYYFEAHGEAFLSALRSQQQQQDDDVVAPMMTTTVTTTMATPPKATEFQHLDEATQAVHDYESFDKILILMRHGEAAHNVYEREWRKKKEQQQCGAGVGMEEEANDEEDYPVDPMLTGKGCGQMLQLSRQTATYCTKQTGLTPELIVVSPLRRAIQSAIIAFPTHTPWASLTNTRWICHPHVMERANGNKSEFISNPESVLKDMFPGVEFDLLQERLLEDNNDVDGEGWNGGEKVPLFENKIELMGRTEEFLRWIRQREERVIVVSSHATWLQSLCAFSLQYEPENKGMEMFKKGEMRSLGIKFD